MITFSSSPCPVSYFKSSAFEIESSLPVISAFVGFHFSGTIKDFMVVK
jgi:hypothetical protein